MEVGAGVGVGAIEKIKLSRTIFVLLNCLPLSYKLACFVPANTPLHAGFEHLKVLHSIGRPLTRKH